MRVVVVVVVVVIIDTMTTTTMRISTRPPLTAASRQDTRTTPRHTYTHTPVCVCVYVCMLFLCAVRLPLVLGALSYTYWPVIGTSEAYLLLEREPNVHQMRAHPHTHTYIYIYMCVCVCVCACVCAGNKNQDYVIPTTRCSLLYHHITQDDDDDDDDREDSACVCMYIHIYVCVEHITVNARTVHTCVCAVRGSRCV